MHLSFVNVDLGDYLFQDGISCLIIEAENSFTISIYEIEQALE